MLKTGTIFFTSLILLANVSFGQQAETVKKYIEQYKGIAIAEMQRTGVPAAITLAQGIHESGAGLGKLAVTANNHFGIKCKSNWTGESVKHTDDAKNECFRKYATAEESYRDHSDFLKNGQRYAFLFEIDPADYTAWANGLKQAGYATNPKYAPAIIKLIEDYQLQDYTLFALNKQAAGNVIAKKEETSADIVPVAANYAIKQEMNTGKIVTPAPVYPSGEFKINETKVMFLKKGTSYLQVAQQYSIELAKLFEINDMDETEVCDRDQLIYLQRKRTKGNNKFHIVQAGETLHDIAQAEAIRLKSLMELNWLETGMRPAPGETLSLQEKSAGIPKLLLKDNYSVLPAVKQSITL
jgi:hypothetical protein